MLKFYKALVITITLCLTLTVASCETTSDIQQIHLRSDLVEFFDSQQIEAIEVIANSFNQAYADAVAANDPLLLGNAYETWNTQHDRVGELSYGDPVEVIDVRWNLNSVGYMLTLVDAVSQMNGTLKDSTSLETTMYFTIKALGAEKSYGGDQLSEENVLEQFWEVANHVYDNFIASYE